MIVDRQHIFDTNFSNFIFFQIVLRFGVGYQLLNSRALTNLINKLIKGFSLLHFKCKEINIIISISDWPLIVPIGVTNKEQLPSKTLNYNSDSREPKIEEYGQKIVKH